MMSYRLITLVIVGFCAVAAQGAPTGNDPNDPIPLTPGQMIVDGELTAADAELDTLLAHTTPGFGTVLALDDNSSTLGGDLASGLFGLPLENDGSIFVNLTGAGNENFIVTNSSPHSHDQWGPYQVQFDFYDTAGDPLESVMYPGGAATESIEPGAVETIFLQGTPERVGGSVDVQVKTFAGSEGNRIDFWLFNDLAPGLMFEAEITSADFASRIGYYQDSGLPLLASSTGGGEGGLPLLAGIVPANGQFMIAVTGMDDDQFLGDHSGLGEYLLQVTTSNPVPEPTSAVLLALGGVAFALAPWRRSTRTLAT